MKKNTNLVIPLKDKTHCLVFITINFLAAVLLFFKTVISHKNSLLIPTLLHAACFIISFPVL